MDAEQVEQLYLDVEPVRRKEVHGAAALDGFVYERLQAAHRRRFDHTDLGGHVADTLDRTVPDDVINVDLVAHKELPAAVGVDNAYQTVAFLPEEVEERTVLAELVGIGGVVDGTVVVPEDEDEPVAHQLAQCGAPLSIGCFGEHRPSSY